MELYYILSGDSDQYGLVGIYSSLDEAIEELSKETDGFRELTDAYSGEPITESGAKELFEEEESMVTNDWTYWTLGKYVK